jgi:hypothetical protein
LVTKSKYPMKRDQWIMQMYDFGNRGIEDFNHLHKKVIPATKNLYHQTRYGVRLKKLDSKLDVKGFDMPRHDIEKVIVKDGKIIRIGSDNIQKNAEYFKKYMVPLINRSFTKKELEGIELYIEYPSKNFDRHKFDGLSISGVSDKNIRFSTIDVSRKKDGPTLIHEILHAVRFDQRRNPKSVHQDEAETTLETMVRLSKYERDQIPCNDGYYDLLKGNKCKARNEDVKLIEKSCNLRDKNGLSRCVRKNLKKTNIGKLKIPKYFIPK